MQRIQLEVAVRNPKASKAADLLKNGRLPGVFYGAGGQTIPVECDAKSFTKLGLGSAGAHLIRFSSPEKSLSEGIALIKDIQHHPVQTTPIHVDFLRVDMNKPVEAAVTLHFTGKSKGVALEGGILQPLRRELEVRALPDQLPESIDIDVTELGIHDSIHVEDIQLPAGVEADYAENFTIVTVLPPVVEAEPVVEEAVEGAIEGAPAADAEAEGGDDDDKKKESE